MVFKLGVAPGDRVLWWTWWLGSTILEVPSNLKDSVTVQERTALADQGTKAMLCCC